MTVPDLLKTARPGSMITRKGGRKVIRTLVVDDDPDFRLLVRVWLEKFEPHRYTIVGEAGSGTEAGVLVDECQPDLVLLDLTMPATDPLETIADLKGRCPRMLLVVVSGYEPGDRLEVTVAHGADGYVEKGASFERLRAEVDAVLARAG